MVHEVRVFYGLDDDEDEDAEEEGGVREPRKPRPPYDSAEAAAEVPAATVEAEAEAIALRQAV